MSLVRITTGFGGEGGEGSWAVGVRGEWVLWWRKWEGGSWLDSRIRSRGGSKVWGFWTSENILSISALLKKSSTSLWDTAIHS